MSQSRCCHSRDDRNDKGNSLAGATRGKGGPGKAQMPGMELLGPCGETTPGHHIHLEDWAEEIAQVAVLDRNPEAEENAHIPSINSVSGICVQGTHVLSSPWQHTCSAPT